jgi:hypothetical protein
MGAKSNQKLSMKPKIWMRLTGLGGGLLVFTLAPTMMRGATGSPPSRPAETSAPAAAPALTRAEALKIIAEARHYVAHPQPPPANSPTPPTNGTQDKVLVTTPAFDMAEPPPAPRAETKPPAPGPGLVWVPGHHMPVQGVWRWVNGEWAVPATPISIWIPASYSVAEKKWSPGYWQPDIATTPTAESTPKPANPAAPGPGS